MFPLDGRLDLIRQPSMSKAGPTPGSLAMSSPAGKDSRVRLGVWRAWEGLGKGYWRLLAATGLHPNSIGCNRVHGVGLVHGL